MPDRQKKKDPERSCSKDTHNCSISIEMKDDNSIMKNFYCGIVIGIFAQPRKIVQKSCHRKIPGEMKNTCKCCCPRDPERMYNTVAYVSVNLLHHLGSWKVSYDCSEKFLIYPQSSAGKLHKQFCPPGWDGKSLQNNCPVKVKWEYNSALYPLPWVWDICLVSSWRVYLHSSIYCTIAFPQSCGTCHRWSMYWRISFNTALGSLQKRYQNSNSWASW